MPEREYLNFVAANPIVEVIANPREVKTFHSLRAHLRHRRSDAGLSAQKQESLREILIEGFRCQVPVLVPPLRGTINLRLCPLGDANEHGLLNDDGVPASQEHPRRKPCPLDPLQQWKEAAPPLVQA